MFRSLRFRKPRRPGGTVWVLGTVLAALAVGVGVYLTQHPTQANPNPTSLTGITVAPATLTITTTGPGTVTPASGTTITTGTPVTITATPDAGKAVATWPPQCPEAGPGDTTCTFLFTGATTIAVAFGERPAPTKVSRLALVGVAPTEAFVGDTIRFDLLAYDQNGFPITGLDVLPVVSTTQVLAFFVAGEYGWQSRANGNAAIQARIAGRAADNFHLVSSAPMAIRYTPPVSAGGTTVTIRAATNGWSCLTPDPGIYTDATPEGFPCNIPVATIAVRAPITYDTLDTTGSADGAGEYTFLQAVGDASTAIENLGNLPELAVELRLHNTDADGTNRTTDYANVAVGDVFDFVQHPACGKRFKVSSTTVGTPHVFGLSLVRGYGGNCYGLDDATNTFEVAFRWDPDPGYPDVRGIRVLMRGEETPGPGTYRISNILPFVVDIPRGMTVISLGLEIPICADAGPCPMTVSLGTTDQSYVVLNAETGAEIERHLAPQPSANPGAGPSTDAPPAPDVGAQFDALLETLRSVTD